MSSCSLIYTTQLELSHMEQFEIYNSLSFMKFYSFCHFDLQKTKIPWLLKILDSDCLGGVHYFLVTTQYTVTNT